MAELINNFSDLNPYRGLSFRGILDFETRRQLADCSNDHLFSGQEAIDELLTLTGDLYGYTAERLLQPLSGSPVTAEVAVRSLHEVHVQRDKFNPEYLATARSGGSVVCDFTDLKPFEQYQERLATSPRNGILEASYSLSSREQTISHFAIELNRK